jgi:hypothetical protein
MMHIDDISLERSRTMPGTYILTIESGGHKFTGQFGRDLNLFFGVVSDALKYFGQVHGLIVPGSQEGTFKAGPKGGKA